MKNQLKSLGSIKFWIFIVALSYFLYAIYFAIYGLSFSLELTHDHYVFNQLTKDPWWWAILYYGSEGIFGFLSGLFRAIAGFYATSAAFHFWQKKDTKLNTLKPKITKALLFEATYFISLTLSVIASFAYLLTGSQFYYFDHLPGLIYVLAAGLPLLAMILLVSPTLLKLRTKIIQNAPTKEIIKWTSLTGVAYLFAVFWFNYSMSWAATLVPYPRIQYGLTFLLKPHNTLSFTLTAFGLLSLAILSLKITLPAIQKKHTQPKTKHIGTLLLALGAYFLFNVLYYYSTGGYQANPSVWYEIIGPLHNPYFWCFTLFFLGLALISKSKKTER